MAKKIRLDFSKVEERSGWNTKEIPEGVHEFKIVGVDVGEAKDGTEMLTYALVPTNAKYKTRRFPYYCKLQQNQLFKVRDLLVAAGISVPKKVTSIDPEAPVGSIVAAEVSDEVGQYAGRSTIDGIYDRSIIDDEDQVDDGDEEEVEDESDEADEVEDDEEFEDEVEDEVEAEEGDDELREELEALTLPALRKRAKALDIDTDGVKKDELIELVLEEELGEVEEDEADDEDDEEEEEPEPAPRRRAAPAKKAPAKAAAEAAPARRVVKRR